MGHLAQHHPETAIEFLHELPVARFRKQTSTRRELHHRIPAALEKALEMLPSQLRRKVEDIKLADALSESFRPTVEILAQHKDGWEVFRRAVSCIRGSGETAASGVAGPA